MNRRPFALTVNGARLLGETLVPAGPPPRSGVILVHGFRAHRDWSFLPWLARELAAAGHMVARFSFSGSGVVAGGDEITDLEAFETNTLTREADELAAVVDAARAGDVFPRPPRRLALLGHARGGALATVVTSESDAVQSLVTLSAMRRFDRWKEETVQEWRARGRLYVLDSRTGRQLPVSLTMLEDFERNRARFDLLERAAAVAVPWLIVHGGDDLTVAPEDGRTLARTGDATRLLLVDGVGHGYGVRHPMSEPSPALERVTHAVVAHLGDPAAASL